MELGKNINEFSFTEFVFGARKKDNKSTLSLGIIPKSWFLKTILQKMGQDSLEKWLISGLELTKYKISLELLVAGEHK